MVRRARRRPTRRTALMLLAGGLLAFGPSATLAASAATAPHGAVTQHTSMSDRSGMCASMNAPWI